MLLTEEEIKRGPFHRNSIGMPDDPVGGVQNGPVGLDMGDRLVAGAPDRLRRDGPSKKEGEDGEETYYDVIETIILSYHHIN